MSWEGFGIFCTNTISKNITHAIGRATKGRRHREQKEDQMTMASAGGTAGRQAGGRAAGVATLRRKIDLSRGRWTTCGRSGGEPRRHGRRAGGRAAGGATGGAATGRRTKEGQREIDAVLLEEDWQWMGRK
jgi:hypothetical protein